MALKRTNRLYSGAYDPAGLARFRAEARRIIKRGQKVSKKNDVLHLRKRYANRAKI